MAGRDDGKFILMAGLSWLWVLRTHFHTSSTSAFHVTKWQLTKRNHAQYYNTRMTWDVILHVGQATQNVKEALVKSGPNRRLL